MTAILLFLCVLVLLIAGLPIAVALGLSSVVYILIFSSDSMSSVGLKFFESTQHYTLLAIPFFIVSSGFMSTGGVAQRIVRFAIATVGQFKGGLAIAGVFACMIFAALSGSSPATVVAVGGIVISGMVKAGYKKEFAAGIICNAGTLGILIPPSIVMVVYAAATDVSVGRMFIGGIIPGILAGFMLMLGIYLVARYKNLPAQPFQGVKEIISALWSAFGGLLLIVIILGGIYGGIFTPTEAAAVAAVYAFLISNLLYRDIGPLRDVSWIHPKTSHWTSVIVGNGVTLIKGAFLAPFHLDNRKIMLEAAKTTVMLMFIIANALLFAHVLTTERIPQYITEAMLSFGLTWWQFLLVVNILLLIGGQFMEPSGLLLIVAPVVFPLAVSLGIDPIHLGIMMVVNMEIGMITPPIGLNLFVTSGITGLPLVRVVRAASPWIVLMLVFLLMITYVAPLSTWLPTLMMGPEIVS